MEAPFGRSGSSLSGPSLATKLRHAVRSTSARIIISIAPGYDDLLTGTTAPVRRSGHGRAADFDVRHKRHQQACR
jgi:hypothetical protein